MSAVNTLTRLRDELGHELEHGILPYWMAHTIDERQGGFVGFIDPDNVPQPDAPRSAVLYTRILWAFASAYRVLGTAEYGLVAEHAVRYLRSYFLDADYGGIYWMVDARGVPLQDRKHVYAQAFAIYGLCEYQRAIGDARSLAHAIELFELIEQHAFDALHGGYHEAFTREWEPLQDVRLSAEDANQPRSMNTHLHLLEAYTSLYRVWPDALLRERLHGLIALFLDHIVDTQAGHVRAFFAQDWTPRSPLISFGHDIETSWLLLEAADLLCEPALRARVKQVSLTLAETVLNEGFDAMGGVFTEIRSDGTVDSDKEWWPQAEALVGFLNAWQESGRVEFIDAALATWDFTKRHIVDAQHGEWHRRVTRDGVLRPGHEKVGPWKCPYHNTRACVEVMRRCGEDVENGLISRGGAEGAERAL